MEYKLIGIGPDGDFCIIRRSTHLLSLEKECQRRWENDREETSVEDDEGKIVFTPFFDD